MLKPVPAPDPDAEDHPKSQERPLKRGVPGAAFFIGQNSQLFRRRDESRHRATHGGAVGNRVLADAVGRRSSFLRDRVSFAIHTLLRSRRKGDAGVPRALQKAGVGIQGQGRWTAAGDGEHRPGQTTASGNCGSWQGPRRNLPLVPGAPPVSAPVSHPRPSGSRERAPARRIFLKGQQSRHRRSTAP